MPEAFEITVHESHIDENVTGETVADDLAGALKAAEAAHVYDLVVAGEKPEGFDKQTRARAEAGVDAALKIVGALGSPKDHYRVSIHGGADHLNVHVQLVAVGSTAKRGDE